MCTTYIPTDIFLKEIINALHEKRCTDLLPGDHTHYLVRRQSHQIINYYTAIILKYVEKANNNYQIENSKR